MAFELIQLYARREAGRGIGLPAGHPLGHRAGRVVTVKENAGPDGRDRGRDRRHGMPTRWIGSCAATSGSARPRSPSGRRSRRSTRASRSPCWVPTTVLALQHFTPSRAALAAFPVRVEMLSRLRSAAQQGVILEDLEAGKVVSSSARTGSSRRSPLQRPRTRRHSTRSSASGCVTRSVLKQVDRDRVLTLSATRDPRHAASLARRHPRHQHERDGTPVAPAEPDVRLAVF